MKTKRYQLETSYLSYLGQRRFDQHIVLPERSEVPGYWLFVRQSTQKVPKWRVSRKQGSNGRISLKIGIDTPFGNRTYPHSVEIHTITLSARAERGLFSRHVKKRPRSARAVKI